MPESFEVSDVVSADPATVYNAWLDSIGHTEMTGGEAECSNELGGTFTAWDGYISGQNLELEPPHRIVQAWSRDPSPRLKILVQPQNCATTGAPHG